MSIMWHHIVTQKELDIRNVAYVPSSLGVECHLEMCKRSLSRR